MKPIKRGNIYFADLNPVIGSEQGDIRPVLVVQNDVGNKHSPTVVIVPLTRNLEKKLLPTHVFIPQSGGLEFDSMALTEQIRTIDRSRFEGYIGHINSKLLAEIDTALAIGIGLEAHHSPKGELFLLTLCSRCKKNFIESGYVVVRKGWQKVMGTCDFCKNRKGIIYGIFNALKNDTAFEPLSRRRTSTKNQT